MSFKNFTKKFKLTFFILIVFSLFSFSQAPNAFACSCARAPIESLSKEGLLSGSDAIFTGRVSNLKYLDKPEQVSPEPRVIVTFDVAQWWKGSNEKQAVLHTVYNTFTCNGYWFKENEEYLVYASKQPDGTFGTSFCKGTNALSEANADLKILGKGKSPVDAGTTEPAPASNNHTKEIVFGIIALVVIGIAYKFVISRKIIKS